MEVLVLLNIYMNVPSVDRSREKAIMMPLGTIIYGRDCHQHFKHAEVVRLCPSLFHSSLSLPFLPSLSLSSSRSPSFPLSHTYISTHANKHTYTHTHTTHTHKLKPHKTNRCTNPCQLLVLLKEHRCNPPVISNRRALRSQYSVTNFGAATELHVCMFVTKQLSRLPPQWASLGDLLSRAQCYRDGVNVTCSPRVTCDGPASC